MSPGSMNYHLYTNNHSKKASIDKWRMNYIKSLPDSSKLFSKKQRINKYKNQNLQKSSFKTHNMIQILMLCAIWYHLYNLKNVKNTHGKVLLLVKLHHSSMAAFTFLNSANGTKSRKASHVGEYSLD